MNSIPALSTYAKLMEDVELSLSNGGQVFRKVILYRFDGKRLYASGTYNYQNGIPKGERLYLLINGEAVAGPSPASHSWLDRLRLIEERTLIVLTESSLPSPFRLSRGRLLPRQ